MKIAALIFAYLAVASAAKACLIYGGTDNGTVLVLYVAAAGLCAAIAVGLGLWSALA